MTRTWRHWVLPASLVVAACAGSAPPAPPENTYWKLLSLRSVPVEVAERQQEPHFILHPTDKRVSGSGGCNRMTGSYLLAGDRLTFSPLAGTRMACPQGMEQEGRYLAALGTVARWRVEGQRMKLFDERGDVVAEFETRYLR
jgi:heat shock protein HslJ